MFLSVSYDLKYQEIARKHMASSRDKEQVKSRHQSMTSQEQAAVHDKSRASSSAELHTATLHSTPGAAPVPKHIAVKTKSCQNTFTVFFLSECNFSKLDML